MTLATSNNTKDQADAQALNALKLRALQVRSGFLSLGTGTYMPFIETQAVREGKWLTPEETKAIRQALNGRLNMGCAPLVELAERALRQQVQG